MTINFCPKASPCPAILSPPLLTHLSLPIFLPTPEEEEGGQSPWAWLPASPCLRHCSLIQPLSWGGGEKGHLLKPSPAPLPHLLPSQGAGGGEDLVLGPRFWTLPAHPILAPWPAAAMPSLARLLLWGGASLGGLGAKVMEAPPLLSPASRPRLRVGHGTACSCTASLSPAGHEQGTLARFPSGSPFLPLAEGGASTHLARACWRGRAPSGDAGQLDLIPGPVIAGWWWGGAGGGCRWQWGGSHHRPPQPLGFLRTGSSSSVTSLSLPTDSSPTPRPGQASPLWLLSPASGAQGPQDPFSLAVETPGCTWPPELLVGGSGLPLLFPTSSGTSPPWC